MNDEQIAKLDKRIQEIIRKFLAKALNQGFNLRITSGKRTSEEQDKLYALGRTIPGKIVTNAQDGESNHTRGIAIDVVERNLGYNIDWEKLGRIGESVGLSWGGRWTTFVDRPHFEKTNFAVEGESENNIMTDDQKRALEVLEQTRLNNNFGNLESTARSGKDAISSNEQLAVSNAKLTGEVESLKASVEDLKKQVSEQVVSFSSPISKFLFDLAIFLETRK